MDDKLFYRENPLNTMDVFEVLRKIELYKKVDLKRISKKRLFELTLETIPCCMVSYKTLPKGTKLFRVRKLKNNEEFRRVGELSYPNKKYVSVRGRFNDVNESILYASLDEVTPFYETKAKIGEAFAFIEYVTNDIIQLTDVSIGNEINSDDLSERGKINHKIIEQFLYTEFTKDVGEGTEYLYRISNMLAKNFLDIPNCEGYLYPSVAFERLYNVAIKPNSVDDKIKIKDVKNVILKELNEKSATVYINNFSDNVYNSENIEYYPYVYK